MNYQFLWDYEENLEKKIKFLLYSDKFSWDKIYLFSAYVSNPGVKKVKEILLAPSLNENTEVVIAIGTQYHFNEPSNLQEILSLSKSQKIRTKFVSFICPKTINDESHINDNFHIKAYCFLGRNRNKIKADIQIGVSIIGSSNLTKAGLQCQGELCISIHNFNLTNKLIEHLKNKYISKSPQWDQEIIEAYARGKYNKEQSRQDQNEVLPQSQENSTPVNQSEPRPGKFIKLGVLTDSDLLAKATNLANDRNIDGVYWSQAIIDEEKNYVPQNSLCLLFSTENKIFQIVEIRSHSSNQEETEGCFVTYRVNVTYKLSEDICEILEKEEYKIIYNPENMEELPYKTLKDFEEEVKKYQKMLDDPNYQTGLKKGEKKMQKMQSEIESLLEKIEEIDLITLKKKLKEIRESI